MTNEKTQKTEVKKNVAKVVKIDTIAKAFEVIGLEGKCKNRDEAAKLIVDLLHKNGVTKTKYDVLTVERVRKQMNNMLYAITKLNMKRWSTYKLVEEENVLKLVNKN